MTRPSRIIRIFCSGICLGCLWSGWRGTVSAGWLRRVRSLLLCVGMGVLFEVFVRLNNGLVSFLRRVAATATVLLRLFALVINVRALAVSISDEFDIHLMTFISHAYFASFSSSERFLSFSMGFANFLYLDFYFLTKSGNSMESIKQFDYK